jgi:adenosylcobyric acid synthase
MTARAIMVQGTASSVGKSIVVTALCRLFRQEGLRVAPFKAQNMALNAYVAADGGEIGRAQAVQAQAAGVAPTVDMNPILLKPEGHSRSQVVVMGRPVGSIGAADYHERKPDLRGVVVSALERLRSAYDIVVIEGAGSPAEINLKDRDLVNMFVAHAADCKVILVGDIDRGGVFAAFVGTLELLEASERARVGAFLINKFRGDLRLLDSGLRFLETRTGIPVLGVVPYLKDLRIADEDSVSLEDRLRRRRARAGEIEIAVVRVPLISNYDDFQPLEHEPGVVVRFVERAEDLEATDLVVLPGSKSTVSDLQWLRRSGIAEAIVARARGGGLVLGVCGGCQMLGERIEDPKATESSEPAVDGLGLLSVRTRFGPDKRTAQVRAKALLSTFLADAGAEAITGYEIHMGRLERLDGAPGPFVIHARNGAVDDDVDGAASSDGAVVGTMIHGLFDNADVRQTLLARLRERKGLPASGPSAPHPDEFDRLAAALRESIDVSLLHRLCRS